MWNRIDFSRPRAVVGWAVLVGVVAGLLAAVYFSVAGEPLIDDAEAIEDARSAEAAHGAHDHDDDGVEVSRGVQRGPGLFGGYAVYGAMFGVLLAVAALSLRGVWLDPFRRVLVAGTILATAFAVVPWFKYPPNPPGVGDESTAGERQVWYLLLVALTALVLGGAAHLSSRLRQRGWDEARRTAAVGAAGLVAMGVVLAVLPTSSVDVPADVPTTLVWSFRVATLAGNLLLWALLTVGFAALWAESERRRAQNSMPFMAEMPSS
jgi:predicted cobalt transporter CbtA